MITNLKISKARVALSSKGQFLIFTASNNEISHAGYFFEIQFVIGISNEQERIQFNYSDFSKSPSNDKLKWTQFFYLAPYFFGILVSNITNAQITINDHEKNINELVNSLSITFKLS